MVMLSDGSQAWAPVRFRYHASSAGKSLQLPDPLAGHHRRVSDLRRLQPRNRLRHAPDQQRRPGPLRPSRWPPTPAPRWSTSSPADWRPPPSPSPWNRAVPASRAIPAPIFGAGAGTSDGAPFNVTLSSPNAINIPPVIRVYMNYRQSDQRGVIFPVPTTPNTNPNNSAITVPASVRLPRRVTRACRISCWTKPVT